MGIEPTALAWEARVLPLYDTRFEGSLFTRITRPGEAAGEKIPRLFAIHPRPGTQKGAACPGYSDGQRMVAGRWLT